MLADLKNRGLQLALVSGDGQPTTAAVGEAIGIETALGDQLPADKAAFVKNLQAKGRRTAMVGDGINDAPALAQADLSVAIHSGGALAKEAADISFMRGDPGQLPVFLDFARQVNRKIHQNLAFTFLYNVLAIPVAMTGWLNPLIAVTAMLLSSISVTGNTLMLVKRSEER
jgi:P-type E1-E2 ATPase